MADILSQEEIDALLDVVDEDDCCVDDNENYEYKPHRQITLYDFKRPNKVSRKDLRKFREIHDKMSRHLAIVLSKKMRSITEIQLHSIDQMTYAEFLMGLPNPTSFNIGTMDPLEGQFCLEINPSIMYPMIDRSFSGNGEPFEDVRLFTDIELIVIKDILSTVESSLNVVWRGIAPAINTSINIFESSPNIIQIAPMNEIVIMVVMEVIIGHSSGMLNIAYPYSMIEPMLYLFEKNDDNSKSQHVFKPNELEAILEVEMEVILDSCQSTLGDLLKLSVGDFIPLNAGKTHLSVNSEKLFSAKTIDNNEQYKTIELQ